MGEYIGDYKSGTCESLYYVRFAGLPAFGQAGIRYLTDHVSHGRFPFPDEDDLFSPLTGKIKDWDRFDSVFGFDRGVSVHAPAFWANEVREDEAGEELGHRPGCQWRDRIDDTLFVVRQKVVATEDGDQIWTVVRCPHCRAMWRLPEAQGVQLAEDIRQNSSDAFQLEMARRIQIGYTPGLVERMLAGEDPFAPIPFAPNDVVVPTRPFGEGIRQVHIGIVTEVYENFAPYYVILSVIGQNGYQYQVYSTEVRKVLDFSEIAP